MADSSWNAIGDFIAGMVRFYGTTCRGLQIVLLDIILLQAGGMAGKAVEYPLDTVKVRLQTQTKFSKVRYTGAVDCFTQCRASSRTF